MNAGFRAVVVDKGTVLEESQSVELTQLAAKSPDYVQRLKSSHIRHKGAVAQVFDVLQRTGWDFEHVRRDEFTGPKGSDLVISVGGDGTVLHASHQTIGVPVLGVNSDPDFSTGYFCGTTAASLEDTLKSFMEGDLPEFHLHRLRTEIDGKTVGPPALNDVLVANRNPAATCRYVLVAGPRAERQRSSGIWISTPAGSTAGIRSAGGVVLPLSGAMLQYIVREPVFARHQHYELLRGIRALDEGIKVVSEMADGYVYIDGPYEQAAFPLGASLRISAHEPLVILGLEPARRER